jgi:hypothetical protein
MKRREFVAGLGATAIGTFAARAQQAMPVIGFLSARSPVESAGLQAAFRRGLAENGTVENQSVAIEYRWALGEYDGLPAMAGGTCSSSGSPSRDGRRRSCCQGGDCGHEDHSDRQHPERTTGGIGDASCGTHGVLFSGLQDSRAARVDASSNASRQRRRGDRIALPFTASVGAPRYVRK